MATPSKASQEQSLKDLLKEFPTNSYEDWLAQINKDLKGKDYQTLISQNYDNINIKPAFAALDIDRDLAKNINEICLQDYKGTENINLNTEKPFNNFNYFIDIGSDFENFLENALKGEFTEKNANISIHNLHNAGANATQEIAVALSMATEFLDKGIKDNNNQQKYTTEDLIKKVAFSIAVGTDFYMEIAKIRALRYLWAKISLLFSPSHTPTRVQIHAHTSLFNKTKKDPYNNVLRATMEAMAAFVGGADTLFVSPHNNHFEQPDEFSERIARNIAIILDKESNLSKVADIAAGAYYLEYLTEQLCQKSWDLFKEIEQKGGFVKAFESGFIVKMVEEVAQKKFEDFRDKKLTLVGVNKYENKQEIHTETHFENQQNTSFNTFSFINEIQPFFLEDTL